MKTSLLFACLLLVLPAAHGGNALPIKTKSGAKLSVPPGVDVSLKLPEKVRLGDAIPGAFTVRNTGGEPFEISTGGDYRGTGFPMRLKIRVTDSRGKVLPDESIKLWNRGGMIGTEKIGPGGSSNIALPLAGYVMFPGAGIFTVEACHDLGWMVEEERPHPVAKANIEIIMPSAEEALARVRDLCSGSDRDRLLQLEKLQHGIFLPALIQEAQAGHANAVTGIAGIRGAAAFEALLGLLENPSPDIVKASAAAVKWQLPDLADAAKPTFPSWRDKATILQNWNPKFRKQLLDAALPMLRSKDAATVELGASFIQAQGDAAQAKPLLDATQTALDGPWEIRSGKGANTLDPPPPLRGLIHAIDALRGRGWRLGPDPDGGSAMILARFRELADPNMPRPGTDGWKQTILAFIDANPPTFRQNAILAIPTPVPAGFEPALMKALDDKDWGVLRSACEVAGKSGRVSFIPPLCRIVETTHQSSVQSAASSAAQALGARVELWEAWYEVITDQESMYEALTELAFGTLEIPSRSGGGNRNFTLEQRFAIRDAWREFIRKNHDRLARGERLPTGDPTVSNSLTGSNFNASDPAIRFRLPDGKSWPEPPVEQDASH
ncbi:HEAT repeat domain-containing protein [Luteolibacter sp. Populi]|uniref:HEAT repeat domain-containing protein n=1 Tax=Luteolibacter sp. Populi TaxID=3230487 RepID=UPI003464ED99